MYARSLSAILTLALLAHLASPAAADDLHVVVYNQRLFVGGTEYFIRGMCYNPLPFGFDNATGLCSPRLTPWGEWKSACYDSDFADGSITPEGTGPPHPNGWFSSMWERDVPAMAAAGVNTIRLYSANAVTRDASIIYNGTHSIVVAGAGKEHVRFLDYCWSFGIRVIFPLLSDCRMYQTLDNQSVEWLLRNQIDEVGNHPAVLMYAIGNEWTGLCPDYWENVTAAMGRAVRYARAYQMQRWGRLLPIMTSVVYRPEYFETILGLMPVDIFGVNSYEGYEGSYTMPNLYSIMKPLICKYGVALFISEFNPQGWQNSGQEYPSAFPTYWHDFITQADRIGIVGAAYFEWTNEPAKRVINQDDMGVVRITPARDPKTGLSTVAVNGWGVPDTATPKDITLQSICCGTYGGAPWNFRTDTWSLMGRQPYSVTNVPAICNGTAPGSSAMVSSTLSTSRTTANQVTSTTTATRTSSVTSGTSTTKATFLSTSGSTTSSTLSVMESTELSSSGNAVDSIACSPNISFLVVGISVLLLVFFA